MVHVHVSVDDLAQSIRFYSVLVTAQADRRQGVCKVDARRSAGQLRNQQARERRQRHLASRHPGPEELAEVYDRLGPGQAKATTCCYARSDKQWIADPQGVPWETFFTYSKAAVTARDRSQKS